MRCAIFRRCLARSAHCIRRKMNKMQPMQPNLSEVLLNTIPLPVLAVDNAGLVVDMNVAAKLLLPPETTFAGKRLDLLFPEWSALLAQLKANRESFRRQVR